MMDKRDELEAEVERLKKCMTQWADYFDREAKNEHGTWMDFTDWQAMANDMRMDRDNIG